MPTRIPPHATLTDTLRMSLELGLVRNRVVVEYGTASPRAAVTVEDAAQIALYGIREARYSTQLATQADATAHANMLMAALDPAWNMPAATVVMRLLDASDKSRVAGIDQGGDVSLPQLLPGSPQSSYASSVLGYTETVAQADWQITFHLAPSNIPVPVRT